MEIIPARVVEICPDLVVEICPDLVVEICPDLVVEIWPVFVVEIWPDLVVAKVVADKAVTNNVAQITDLRFFIVLLLDSSQGYLVGLEIAAKPFFRPTSNK